MLPINPLQTIEATTCMYKNAKFIDFLVPHVYVLHILAINETIQISFNEKNPRINFTLLYGKKCWGHCCDEVTSLPWSRLLPVTQSP